MTKQEALVIQDLIGGEIVDWSPGVWSVELDVQGKKTSLSMHDGGWFIVDDLGNTVFSSDDLK